MLYVASLSKEDARRALHSFHYLIFHQILRFVREWSSLTAMKQKIIRKSGQLFRSPALALEEIAKHQTKQNSTKQGRRSLNSGSLKDAKRTTSTFCIASKAKGLTN